MYHYRIANFVLIALFLFVSPCKYSICQEDRIDHQILKNNQGMDYSYGSSYTIQSENNNIFNDMNRDHIDMKNFIKANNNQAAEQIDLELKGPRSAETASVIVEYKEIMPEEIIQEKEQDEISIEEQIPESMIRFMNERERDVYSYKIINKGGVYKLIWVEAAEDGAWRANNTALLYQAFDESGEKIGRTIRFDNDSSNNSILKYDLIDVENNCTLLIWENAVYVKNDFFENGIYYADYEYMDYWGQLINGDGSITQEKTRISSEHVYNHNIDADQVNVNYYDRNIVKHYQGHILVFWGEDEVVLSGGIPTGIKRKHMYQVFDKYGQKIEHENVLYACSREESSIDPLYVIRNLGNGSFAIFFQNENMRLQVVSKDGQLVGNPTIVMNKTMRQRNGVDDNNIFFNRDNELTVIWFENNTIFLKTFDLNGEITSNKALLETEGEPYIRHIRRLRDGNIAIIYLDDYKFDLPETVTGRRFSLMAAVYDESGNIVAGGPTILSGDRLLQSSVYLNHVKELSNGNIGIIWRDPYWNYTFQVLSCGGEMVSPQRILGIDPVYRILWESPEYSYRILPILIHEMKNSNYIIVWNINYYLGRYPMYYPIDKEYFFQIYDRFGSPKSNITYLGDNNDAKGVLVYSSMLDLPNGNIVVFFKDTRLFNGTFYEVYSLYSEEYNIKGEKIRHQIFADSEDLEDTGADIENIRVNMDSTYEILWSKRDVSNSDAQIRQTNRTLFGESGLIIKNNNRHPDIVRESYNMSTLRVLNERLPWFTRYFFNVNRQNFNNIGMYTGSVMSDLYTGSPKPYDNNYNDNENGYLSYNPVVSMDAFIKSPFRVDIQDSIRNSLGSYAYLKRGSNNMPENNLISLLNDLDKREHRSEFENAIVEASMVVLSESSLVEDKILNDFEHIVKLITSSDPIKNILGEADFVTIQRAFIDLNAQIKKLYNDQVNSTTGIYDQLMNLLCLDIDGKIGETMMSVNSMDITLKKKLLVDFKIRELSSKQHGQLNDNEIEAVNIYNNEILPIRKLYSTALNKLVKGLISRITAALKQGSPYALREDSDSTNAMLLLDESIINGAIK